MTEILHSSQPLTLADYLAVARRRKWVIVQAAILVPLVAIVLSMRQTKIYEASAEVLLSRANLSAQLTGVTDPNLYVDPNRFVQTQADLARVPEVARRAIATSGVQNRSAGALLANSSVSPQGNSDLLKFTVQDRNPAVATALATAYAKEFTNYRQELDTGNLEQARTELLTRLKALADQGQAKSALYASLAEKEQQLRLMETLQTQNTVVRPAGDAGKVKPTPKRNGLLGAFLGVVLGIGLAFLWEALDRRVREEEEIEKRLGLPLLARLPEPPKKLRAAHRLVMLEEPKGTHAEAYRRLRTSLEFANLERGAKVIMVASAIQREGKSTTISNLAIALARAGRRVALVDLDLRQPRVGTFFNLDGRPGITDVALGHVALDKAITSVPITRARFESLAVASNGQSSLSGLLEVLPAGTRPSNPGEFVETKALASVLEELRARADLVLIDAPPLLAVGDSMTLSPKVDALIVVTRLSVIRRPTLKELARVLAETPTMKFGFVLTGSRLDETYGYASYGYASESEPVRGRALSR